MKKKENKKITKDKTKGSKKIVSRIINILSIIVLAVFLYYIYKSNLFPIKYFRITAIALVSLEIIYTLLCINKKRLINQKLKEFGKREYTNFIKSKLKTTKLYLFAKK